MKIKEPAKQYNKIILPIQIIDKTNKAINKYPENQLNLPEEIIKIDKKNISKPDMLNNNKNRKTYLKSADESILLLTIIAATRQSAAQRETTQLPDESRNSQEIIVINKTQLTQWVDRHVKYQHSVNLLLSEPNTHADPKNTAICPICYSFLLNKQHTHRS
ncbi:hypothetical protein ACNSO8_16575 [Yersinia sp. LJYL362]|uniref:hypothetical protein n=1 Tax=Yersinia sp. LJYL362 TaxID=3402108 RepID=UPI003AB1C9D8